MKLMEYEGFYGSVEASVEDGCLFGKLEFIDPLVNYEGTTVQEVEVAFQEAVNDYIKNCEELNVEPRKPYRGTFNVRIGHDLHRAAAISARQKEINLNELVKRAIEREITIR